MSEKAEDEVTAEKETPGNTQWRIHWEKTGEIREAQLAELRDVMRHRAEYERLLAESNATNARTHDRLDKLTVLHEREVEALERIARALEKPVTVMG
jgi:hypothetical protein